MKNSTRFILVFLVIPVLSFLESCQMEGEIIIPSSTTFYGDSIAIGNGYAKAWVSENSNGDPTAVGINISEKGLEELPDSLAQFVLPLPKNKGKDFYTHALLDWNPEGHEPPGIYNLPHFDFHFYIISNEERMSIGPKDTVQFANAPDSMYVPSSYMQIPGGVPGMGAHWADLLSSEFKGEIFTKTFVWGSYDGKFTFWEPMVSLNYLLTHPNDVVPLRQPEAYQRDGWYATKYKVSYSTNPNKYTVALTNLQFNEID